MKRIAKRKISTNKKKSNEDEENDRGNETDNSTNKHTQTNIQGENIRFLLFFFSLLIIINVERTYTNENCQKTLSEAHK